MANKLELTWVGKENKIDIEPRILIEKPELGYSYSQAKKHGQISIDEVSNADGIYDNMLIHGDNLLALKALEQEYAGKVKCIYIDPPYNTGSAFEHYDDNLEHSTWLSLMKPRLEILKNLLDADGFLCCHIDDSESHYLKVLLDEIFGRSNYLTTLYVRVRYPDKTLKSDMDFHKEIEQVFIYRKDYGAVPHFDYENVGFDKFLFRIEEIENGEEIKLGGKKVIKFNKNQYRIICEECGSEFGLKEIWASGTILDGNSSGRFFRDYLTGRYKDDGYGVLYKIYGIGDDRYDYRYFTGPQKVGATKGKYYQGVPKIQLENGTVKRKKPINGFHDLAGNFGNCRLEGGVGFRGGKKPEILLQTMFEYFSNPGDLVLDSFLGSGTTAAVAHKMGRRWIGIEMGEHAYTHCKVRLDKVVSGEDQGGISKAQNWKGGGGYKFYELAPSLILKDKYGREIINPVYNADMLAAAMAKQEGCVYCPSAECYWKQAKSTENAYLYTTTQHLTREYLEEIAGDLKDDEHLIIACKSFEPSLERAYKNITIKKIPNILLDRCEFGKSDYKLNVVDMPVMDEEEDDE